MVGRDKLLGTTLTRRPDMRAYGYIHTHPSDEPVAAVVSGADRGAQEITDARQYTTNGFQR